MVKLSVRRFIFGFFFSSLHWNEVMCPWITACLTWRRMSSDASWAGRGCCRRWWWRTLLRGRAQSTTSAQTFLESSPSRTCPTQTGPPRKCFRHGCSASNANMCNMWHSISRKGIFPVLNLIIYISLAICATHLLYLNNDSLIGLFVQDAVSRIGLYLLPDRGGDGWDKRQRVQVQIITQYLCKHLWGHQLFWNEKDWDGRVKYSAICFTRKPCCLLFSFNSMLLNVLQDYRSYSKWKRLWVSGRLSPCLIGLEPEPLSVRRFHGSPLGRGHQNCKGSEDKRGALQHKHRVHYTAYIQKL